jgi:hypothetical protein
MKHEPRNMHDGADDSVRGEKGQFQEIPSTSILHFSQETVQALTDALIELQMELRDRCHECEVLRATVEGLSSELRTSDISLEEAELRAEKLDFRIQAVSYCHQSDLAANEETEGKTLTGKQSKEGKQLLATDKESKKSKKKGKSSMKEKSARKSVFDKKKHNKHKSSRSKAERESLAEAECRDDSNSEPRPKPEAEPDPEAEPKSLVSSVSPRQAAIQSDQAQAHARKLAGLLEESQLQFKTLTSRLDRMTVPVELAHQDESWSKQELDANTNVKRRSKLGAKRGVSGVDSDVASYRKNGEKSRSRCIVSCPSSLDLPSK